MSISVNYISTIEKQVDTLVSDYRTKAQQLEADTTSKIEKAKKDSLQTIEQITAQKRTACEAIVATHREQAKQDETIAFETFNQLVANNENQLVTTILEEVHRRYGSN